MTRGFFPRGSFAIVILTCVVGYLLSIDWSPHEEIFFKTGDFIRKNGYDYEEHTVESVDGIISTIYRIVPRQKVEKSKKKHVPVLMESGMGCSSDVMALNRSDLSFILANEGFDVWLGNYRGGRYTIPGPRANLSDPRTLNDGLEEQSLDIGATIDYILNNTGHKQLDLTNLSAGSPTVIVMQATLPEYNQKIRKVLHLGPGYVCLMANLMQVLYTYVPANFPRAISFIMEWSYAKARIVYILCTQTFLKSVCRTATEGFVGLPDDIGHPEDVARLMILHPSGIPVRAMKHLMQVTLGDGELFRRLDWGVEENLRRYNSSIPPVYDVSHISTYTKAYIAGDDSIVNYTLPRKIFSKMPNYGGEYVVQPPFDHINFALNGMRNPAFISDVIQTLSSE